MEGFEVSVPESLEGITCFTFRLEAQRATLRTNVSQKKSV